MSVVSQMPAAMWTQSMTNPPVGPPARVPLKTLSGEWSHQVNTHGPLYHSHSCVLSSPSDFGFERVNLNSPCTPLPYLSWPPSPPDNCPEGSSYTYTSGSAPLLLACAMYGCHSVRDHSLPPSPPPLSLPLPHTLTAIARWQGTAVSLVMRSTFYQPHGPVQSVHPRVFSSPTPCSLLLGKV